MLAAERWVDAGLQAQLLSAHDSSGFAREDDWLTGVGQTVPRHKLRQDVTASAAFAAILDKARNGRVLSETEVASSFAARGDDVQAVCEAADAVRREVNGPDVSYVVNRNINYTNVCKYACTFCAFSKGRAHAALRGKPYDLDMAEFARRVREAWARGANAG